MPVPGRPGRFLPDTPAGVAWARQNSVELGPHHPLDELPNPVPKPGLDRIEPIVEKPNGLVGRRQR